MQKEERESICIFVRRAIVRTCVCVRVEERWGVVHSRQHDETSTKQAYNSQMFQVDHRNHLPILDNRSTG